AVSLLVLLVLWELGARSELWLRAGVFRPLRAALEALGLESSRLPVLGAVPAPSAVAQAALGVLVEPGYWLSGYRSFARVLAGFAAAVLVGLPFGLLLSVNR